MTMNRIAIAAFSGTLAGVTKPKIAWWLIYLLTGVYVIIIGPVVFSFCGSGPLPGYLLAGFLGTVTLFAWVFTAVGRRGYGESQVAIRWWSRGCCGGREIRRSSLVRMPLPPAAMCTD